MQSVKRHLAPVMAGLVILGGASYVLAAEGSSAPPSEEVALAQSSSDEPGNDEEDGRRGHRPHHPGLPNAIRGELTVHARDGEGFDTVRFDRGVLDRIDGTTLVVTEDDGTTVEIPTDDETRFGRDGERATVEDLRSGDHVAAFRVEEGDAFVTKGVRAISPERWEEFEERRERGERFQGRRPGTAQ